MNRLKMTPLALILTTALSACVTTNPPATHSSNAPSNDTTSKASSKEAEKAKCQPTAKPAPLATKEESKDKKGANNKKGNKTETVAQSSSEATECLPFPSDPANKVVPATELLTELRSLRGSFTTPNPMKSLDSFLAQPGQALTGLNKNGSTAQAAMPTSFNMGSIGSMMTDGLLDKLVSEMSYTAIEQFFGQMTEDKDILKRVSVEIPDTSKLAPPVRKQVLSLAAYMAAIKASGVMIDASLKDFEAAKASYLKALAYRQEAVSILGQALYDKSGLEVSEAEGKKRGLNYISDPAQKALLDSLRGKRPEELINDFEAQNLALAYAKSKQPELYKNYNAEVQQVKTHYGAYARTMAGAGSMLGFTAIFVKKAKTMFDQQGPASVQLLQPLAMQGLKEAIALAPRIKNTFDGGDDMVDGSFKIRFEGEEKPRKIQLTAKKALDALDSESKAKYQDSLINKQGNGLLYALYQRSPKQAGTLLDHLSDKDTRSAISKHALQREDAKDFNFQNAFDGKFPLDKREKKMLTADLLSSPLSSSNPDEGDKALIKLQNEVRSNFSSYTNADLRKLIYAASSKNKLSPGLPLGKVTIQIDALGISGMAEQDEIAASSLAHATVQSTLKKQDN